MVNYLTTKGVRAIGRVLRLLPAYQYYTAHVRDSSYSTLVVLLYSNANGPNV